MRRGADDRQALEQLCRHITRPTLGNERVQKNAAGQVVLKLKTPWRDAEPPAQAALPAECAATSAHHRPVRLSWSKLLKRVFEIDMAHCPNCDGRLKIIAAIMAGPVIEKIFTHLGLQARAPTGAPARGSQPQAA